MFLQNIIGIKLILLPWIKKNNRRWKNFVDKKNEELGWFDLGNHIIILGVILFAIFIAKNA